MDVSTAVLLPKCELISANVSREPKEVEARVAGDLLVLISAMTS